MFFLLQFQSSQRNSPIPRPDTIKRYSIYPQLLIPTQIFIHSFEYKNSLIRASHIKNKRIFFLFDIWFLFIIEYRIEPIIFNHFCLLYLIQRIVLIIPYPFQFNTNIRIHNILIILIIIIWPYLLPYKKHNYNNKLNIRISPPPPYNKNNN